jgi:hypothetical protein
MMDAVAVNDFAVHLVNFRCTVAMLSSLKDTEIPPPDTTIISTAIATAGLASATRRLEARHVTPQHTRLLDYCNKLRDVVIPLAEEYQRPSSGDDEKVEIMLQLLEECAVFEDNFMGVETKRREGELRRARLEARRPCKFGDRVERVRAN